MRQSIKDTTLFFLKVKDAHIPKFYSLLTQVFEHNTFGMYSALTFLHLYDLLFCIKAQGSQGYLKIVLTMYLVVLSIVLLSIASYDKTSSSVITHPTLSLLLTSLSPNNKSGWGQSQPCWLNTCQPGTNSRVWGSSHHREKCYRWH